jgi:hypothetical protein
MNYQVGDAPEVEYERAFVVYDSTGAIVHHHVTTTFVGAEGRSEGEDEERAVEMARDSGHRETDLLALPVPAGFELQASDRVDVAARRLIADRPAAT